MTNAHDRVAEVRKLRKQRDKAKALLDAYTDVREDLLKQSYTGNILDALDSQRSLLTIHRNRLQAEIRDLQRSCVHAWERCFSDITKTPWWQCTQCDNSTEIEP